MNYLSKKVAEALSTLIDVSFNVLLERGTGERIPAGFKGNISIFKKFIQGQGLAVPEPLDFIFIVDSLARIQRKKRIAIFSRSQMSIYTGNKKRLGEIRSLLHRIRKNARLHPKSPTHPEKASRRKKRGSFRRSSPGNLRPWQRQLALEQRLNNAIKGSSNREAGIISHYLENLRKRWPKK
ncbi:MAG: hypothetical protein V1494_02970 [Candidatus Diapherotrites archaeon]